MTCENCGIEFFNTCINCGRANNNKNRCDKCLYVVELNIKQDKKFKEEGLPIPTKWDVIMRESLHPEILCPNCISLRNKKVEDDNRRFWNKFRRDYPI